MVELFPQVPQIRAGLAGDMRPGLFPQTRPREAGEEFIPVIAAALFKFSPPAIQIAAGIIWFAGEARGGFQQSVQRGQNCGQ